MKKSILITCILLFIFSSNTNAQLEKLQAIFIYNFTKYIEWPPAYRSGNFEILILGNSTIDTYLKNIATTKKVGSQPIVTKKINSVNEITKCHILFISTNKSSELQRVISKVGASNTLIITEKNGLASHGAAISFVIVSDKQRFELNKKNVTKYGLKYSKELELLAIQVN